MAAARKTKEQIMAERAAAAKGFKEYKKTRPSKEAIAAQNNAPAKPLTAAERAARQKAMEAKKKAIVRARPTVKPKPAATPVAKKLTGPAAIKELQNQTSKKGVASMEKKAQAALDKKYGWMK